MTEATTSRQDGVSENGGIPQTIGTMRLIQTTD
jgi:hypothetical protein